MWNIKYDTNESLWNGQPLQYSCLENPMGRGAWWAIQFMGLQRVGYNWETNAFTLTKQKQTQGHGDQTFGCQGGGDWGGAGVKVWVSGCELLYTEWISNKALLYSTGMYSTSCHLRWPHQPREFHALPFLNFSLGYQLRKNFSQVSSICLLVSHIGRQFLTTSTTWEAPFIFKHPHISATWGSMDIIYGQWFPTPILSLYNGGLTRTCVLPTVFTTHVIFTVQFTLKPVGSFC